jgi:hypothetical protein
MSQDVHEVKPSLSHTSYYILLRNLSRWEIHIHLLDWATLTHQG